MKHCFTEEDIITYLEEKIINNTYNENELDCYIYYKSNREIDCDIFETLISEMINEYKGVDISEQFNE